jgi:hypothetical protein
MQVSYVDPSNDNVSRIIALNPKSRTLSKAAEEYKEMQTQFEGLTGKKAGKFAKENFPILINKWSGAKLYADLFSKTDINAEDLKNRVKLAERAFTKVEKADYKEINEQLDTIFGVLEKWSSNFSEMTEDDKNIVLGLVKGQTRVGNIGLRLLEVLNENEIEALESLEEYKNEGYKVFYNASYVPSNTEMEERKMDPSFIKYYELSSFLEPPVFMINLQELTSEQEEQIKAVEDVEEVVPPTIADDIPPRTDWNKTELLQVSIGKDVYEVPVDFSLWPFVTAEDEERLLTAIGILKRGFTSSVQKINGIVLEDPNADLTTVKEELLKINIAVFSASISKPNIYSGGILNTHWISTMVSTISSSEVVNGEPLSEDTLDFLDTGNNIEEYTMSGSQNTNNKELTENKQLIKSMCK